MRPVGLIVTREDTLAEHLVQELRALGWIAVPIDSADVALEMMEAVTISLVMVDVAGRADWPACRRLAKAGQSRVAIVTSFLARDRRYRRQAFEMGVAAYVCKPCARGRLREMLRRLQGGEQRVELVAGAMPRLSD